MKQMRFLMLHKLLMLLFTLSSSLYTFAGWNSFIVNFDKNLYGKGAQTWQIAPYDDKWVYFANKNGMLQFDGNVWSVFPINNGSDVRSVLVSATQKKYMPAGLMNSAIMSRVRTALWFIIACPIPWTLPAVLWGMYGEFMKQTIYCTSRAMTVSLNT